MVAKLENFPQLISNEVSDCIPNILQICSHVFELGDLQLKNLLFSDCYLSLLFNFRMGLSLGLTYLISSMFVIILIIRIIKTTCFDNTILMAELEGKVP